MIAKLQVRLDHDLARAFASARGRGAAHGPVLTTSVLARCLLREALAARHGKVMSADEQGFREGWLRGYAEAQRAAQEALYAAALARGGRR